MILLLLAATEVRAQQVTFSNNLLYDTWLTPNLRMGVRLAPHWSVGVNGGYRPWPTDDMKTRKWKHLLVSPDVRYWTDSVNVHHFFGINLIYSHYNIANVKFPFGMWKSLRHERREGDLGAIGAYYGYSWPIARHWNIEAHIGAALAYTRYDKFECGHCGRKLVGDLSCLAVPALDPIREESEVSGYGRAGQRIPHFEGKWANGLDVLSGGRWMGPFPGRQHRSGPGLLFPPCLERPRQHSLADDTRVLSSPVPLPCVDGGVGVGPKDRGTWTSGREAFENDAQSVESSRVHPCPSQFLDPGR